jgi:hypothetical protein
VDAIDSAGECLPPHGLERAPGSCGIAHPLMPLFSCRSRKLVTEPFLPISRYVPQPGRHRSSLRGNLTKSFGQALRLGAMIGPGLGALDANR